MQNLVIYSHIELMQLKVGMIDYVCQAIPQTKIDDHRQRDVAWA